MRERSIDGLNQFFSGLDYCSVECWCLDINFNSILFHPLYAFFYFFCSAAQKQICVVGACPFAIEASSDPRCFLPLFRPSSNKSTLPISLGLAFVLLQHQQQNNSKCHPNSWSLLCWPFVVYFLLPLLLRLSFARCVILQQNVWWLQLFGFYTCFHGGSSGALLFSFAFRWIEPICNTPLSLFEWHFY